MISQTAVVLLSGWKLVELQGVEDAFNHLLSTYDSLLRQPSEHLYAFEIYDQLYSFSHLQGVTPEEFKAICLDLWNDYFSDVIL